MRRSDISVWLVAGYCSWLNPWQTVIDMILPDALRRQSVVLPWVVAIFSAAYATCICLHGVPVLRHDWQWPTSVEQAAAFFTDAWSGWNPRGIGSPAPYPSSYLLAIPVWTLLHLVGPGTTLFFFVFACGAAVTYGVHALCRETRASPVLEVPLMAFALFNAWVYEKSVAGHVIMVMAYGGTILLLACMHRSTLSWKAIAVPQLLMYGQIQFYLIGLVIVLLRARDREAQKALLFGMLLFLPSLSGILFAWHALSGIPYAWQWQTVQSVAPRDAWALAGYFAGYTRAFTTLVQVCGGLAIAAAFLGLLHAWREGGRIRRFAVIVGLTGIAALLAAMGTRGPFASLYTFFVLHVPASGLFRELYDLLAYTLIAYVALSACNAGNRAAAGAVAFAAAIGVATWVAYPPDRFFVHSERAPVSAFSAPANTRYALYPFLQPLTAAGEGSGLDPDRTPRSHNVTPLNTDVVEYPASPALQEYATHASRSMLAALSVSTILTRHSLRTDAGSLRAQLGHVPASGSGMTADLRHIAYIPELSVIPTPHVVAIGRVLGNAAVFFADARGSGLAQSNHLPNFQPVHGPNQYVDAARGWVDPQFIFLSHPELSEGLGGAATLSSLPLAVPQKRAILAAISGELTGDNGQLLATNTHGYSWFALRNARSVRCAGVCVVAGVADDVPRLPSESAPGPYRPASFYAFAPWYVRADLPIHSAGALRYNVGYSAWWIAIAGGHVLRHVRLDQTVNGWLLPAGVRRVAIVHLAAAVQTVLEIVGAAVAFLFLPISSLRDYRDTDERRVLRRLRQARYRNF